MSKNPRTSPSAPKPTAAAPIDPGMRERLLDAGEQCMRRFGLQKFSMEDVARHADASRGSVYRYFPDRNALVEAVLARTALKFVANSENAVKRRRTLAAQVAEAAVFILEHLHDEVLTLYLPGEGETLFATLLTGRIDGLLGGWIEFWQPYLAEAEKRGEIRKGLDHREVAEWIVRAMISFAVMPSAVLDLKNSEVVRNYVIRYIVRGLD